jgi:type I restriction enzyme S subunit
MKKYPKYKVTSDEWISDIPSQWEESKICYVSNIENSGIWGADDEFENSKAILIPTTAQLGIDGIWDISSMATRYVSEDEYNRYLCKQGDIVVVKASGSATNIITGKCGFISENEDSQFGFGNFLLRVRPTTVESKFVFYFLFSHITKMRIEKMVSATTYPNLKVEEYNKSLIFIPPPAEQQQIVNYLDQKTTLIDQIISSSEKKIELLKEQRTAIINQAVTKGLNPKVKMKDSGVEWIGEIPEGWILSKVKWEMNFHNNKRVPIEGEKRSYMSGEYPYYGASGIVDYVNDYIFDGTYILVGEDGANILSRSTPLAFIVQGKFWVNNHAHILTSISGVIDYFCYQLELNDYSTVASGSAQPKLTKEALSDINVISPPLSEQQQIVTYLDQKTKEIDDLIASEKKRIELLKEYRHSLISEVVTGKIKVTNE